MTDEQINDHNIDPEMLQENVVPCIEQCAGTAVNSRKIPPQPNSNPRTPPNSTIETSHPNIDNPNFDSRESQSHGSSLLNGNPTRSASQQLDAIDIGLKENSRTVSVNSLLNVDVTPAKTTDEGSLRNSIKNNKKDTNDVQENQCKVCEQCDCTENCTKKCEIKKCLEDMKICSNCICEVTCNQQCETKKQLVKELNNGGHVCENCTCDRSACTKECLVKLTLKNGICNDEVLESIQTDPMQKSAATQIRKRKHAACGVNFDCNDHMKLDENNNVPKFNQSKDYENENYENTKIVQYENICDSCDCMHPCWPKCELKKLIRLVKDLKETICDPCECSEGIVCNNQCEALKNSQKGKIREQPNKFDTNETSSNCSGLDKIQLDKIQLDKIPLDKIQDKQSDYTKHLTISNPEDKNINEDLDGSPCGSSLCQGSNIDQVKTYQVPPVNANNTANDENGKPNLATSSNNGETSQIEFYLNLSWTIVRELGAVTLRIISFVCLIMISSRFENDFRQVVASAQISCTVNTQTAGNDQQPSTSQNYRCPNYISNRCPCKK